MRPLILRGGTLALPGGLRPGDLELRDGKIAAIGAVSPTDHELVDARGLLVMPGVIDPQVHFREPGNTHKEDLATGSSACAAGGVTSFLEMPNTEPPTTTRALLDDKLARAQASSLVGFGFFIGATPDNLEELLALEGADDVCGIKIFMGSSTGRLLVSERADLERIFGSGRRLIAVHAEDEARLKARKAAFPSPRVEDHSELRDAEAARLATELALELSERFDRRLHVLHLSTADEVALLRARKVPGRVSAEVTPQHLLLNAPEIYARLGTRAQMNPPLRSRSHSEALWKGLHEGLLDCIATDHAPHTLEEKARPYGQAPSGMPGVETALAAMLDAARRGLCAVEDVVRWMTSGPARCYGMRDRGELRVGLRADLALVDLGRSERVEDRKIRTKVGWSPFEGVTLTGWPIATIVGGRFVYRDGELVESARGQAERIRFARAS